MKIIKWIITSSLFIIAILTWFSLARSQHYESYYRYIGNYPHNDETDFSENLQGVTHDNANWFFTQKEDLWKIPVEFDLNDLPNSNRIIHIDMTELAGYKDLGYDHLGDLSYYEYQGKGYLVIPLEGKSPIGMGVFYDNKTNNTLDWLGYDTIITEDGSWIAIDDEGYIYTSKTWNDIDRFSKYQLDWSKLQKNPPIVEVTYLQDVQIYNQNGLSLKIQHSQGASFSESGELLYVLTGGPSSSESDCAIHVFDTYTWQRIAVSSQTDPFFNYECHPGDLGEESEGVTVWDLDDGRAPGIRGQLHVIQIDVDILTDNLYFQHYTGTVYTDAAYSGSEDGTLNNPFNTVTEATNYAWDGSKISIKAGYYSGNQVSFSKRVQVVSREGKATFGNKGQISLTTSAKINLSNTGVLKLY